MRLAGAARSGSRTCARRAARSSRRSREPRRPVEPELSTSSYRADSSLAARATESTRRTPRPSPRSTPRPAASRVADCARARPSTRAPIVVGDLRRRRRQRTARCTSSTRRPAPTVKELVDRREADRDPHDRGRRRVRPRRIRDTVRGRVRDDGTPTSRRASWSTAACRVSASGTRSAGWPGASEG